VGYRIGLNSLLLCAIVIGSIFSGCGEKKALSAEPTAGSWKPILLPSIQAIRLPPPPAENADQPRREIQELVSFQTQRTPQMETAINFWNVGAAIRWNEIAREAVAKNRTDPVMASRVYALLSVAQYDALIAAWNNKYFHHRLAPTKMDSNVNPFVTASLDPVYPSEHAAIAAASAAVLGYLYPRETAYFDNKAKEHTESRLWAGVNFRSDITSGEYLGREVADLVIKRARIDGADTVSVSDIPPGEGKWTSAPNAAQVFPSWGRVTPWLMASVTEFRAPPPPTFDSPTFNAALSEVRQTSDTRTPEQARIAALWVDGAGSYTPPGRWNKAAADLILKYRLNEVRAARVFALTNMAMMDAGIACWDTKFHYAVLRPSQADPAITTPVGLPNFPSYTSAHSTFSGAGAEVLGQLFPKEKSVLNSKAEEAGASRIYGGIHYRFDHEAGAAQGRAIAQLAIKRGQGDGSPR